MISATATRSDIAGIGGQAGGGNAGGADHLPAEVFSPARPRRLQHRRQRRAGRRIDIDAENIEIGGVWFFANRVGATMRRGGGL